MEEVQFVVEWKTTGELFKQKFVYTTYCNEFESHFLYINDNTGEELEIRKEFLEYIIKRPIRYDEE
jgi:hypothetical protein